MKKNLTGSEMNTSLNTNAQPEFSRRRFIQTVAVTGVSSVVPTAALVMDTPESHAQDTSPKTSASVRTLPNPIIPNFQGEYGDSSTPGFQIPKRPMGNTGLQVSILGMGGYHLGAALSQNIVNNMVAKAIDHGINFFDNAWEYQDGAAEERLGIALKGKRDGVILATGVCTYGRKKDVAMRMLEDSLTRLQTDHIDVGSYTMSFTTTIPNLLTRLTEHLKHLPQPSSKAKSASSASADIRTLPSTSTCSIADSTSTPCKCRSIPSTQASARLSGACFR